MNNLFYFFDLPSATSAAEMNVSKPKTSSEEGGIKKKGEVIHSGHFMISSVSEDQDDHESLVQDRDSPLHHEHMKMMQNGT